MESSYTSEQGKPYFVFSGDPSKKADDFLWVAQCNKDGCLSIKFSKPADISRVVLYNYPEKRRTKLLGIRVVSITINKLATSGRNSSQSLSSTPTAF